ncbi:MAG: hypothetical protein ACAI44_32690 [Candidatus Sericytochromatia bacterium]
MQKTVENDSNNPRMLMARGLALVVDLLLIYLLGMTARENLPYEYRNEWVWLIGLPLIWTFHEAVFRSSLGRWLVGLKLDIPGGILQRCLRLTGRNLLKYSQLFFVFSGWFVLFPYLEQLGLLSWLDYPYRTQIQFLMMLFPPVMISLLFHPGLLLGQHSPVLPGKVLHDWFSGCRPSFAYGQKTPAWQLGISCLLVGVLTSFAIPSRVYGCGGGLISVKDNMHTLQTIVETYAVDHGGFYAPSIGALSYAAHEPGLEYWKDFRNPFTSLSGFSKSLQDEVLDPQKGIVTYQPIPDGKGRFSRYKIYGYDKAARRIRDKGADFVLSND